MAINMQGPWTVAVKYLEPFEAPQRFIISGAATGNGTYDVTATTPPVYVTGTHWSLKIQMKRGKVFLDSPDKLTFPVVTNGNYVLEIQSNVPADDPDWDDLILTCSTPVTLEDYLVYGNVSYYSSGCLFNPCQLPHLVIETPAALAAALRNPTLRVPIEKLYPNRLRWPDPPPPGPQPDPAPFVPLVVPLREMTAIPAQTGQIFKLSAATKANARASTADTAQSPAVLSGSFTVPNPTAAVVDFDRLAVAKIVDGLHLFCATGPLPGVVLRFMEYDRTSAELAGGAYSGTGAREKLGVCATDTNGNYVFRFSRTLAQYLQEVSVDTAPGETALTQLLPDLLVQLLSFAPSSPVGYCYESAPYWNVPFLKHINICVPQSVAPMPTACQGGNAIQAIGNIFIGAPQPDGSRVGYSNYLGAAGRITSRSSLAGTPDAQCAAWAGLLDLFACFTDHPEVTQYTIRYRTPGAGWMSFQEYYSHPEVAKIALPWYSGTKVGPFNRALTVDGVANTSVPAYDNIENNEAFVLTHRNRKGWISSWIYPAVHTTLYGARRYGTVEFWIEGYTTAGARVAGAEDRIALYIDNNGPDFNIASVAMQAQTGGDCALFNLNGQAATPLTVKFRANQLEGFLSSFALTVRKGNIGGLVIDDNGPGLIAAAYVHGDDLLCSALIGTLNDPVSDGDGYVIADIVPHNGLWLAPGQPFCTFAVQLSCAMRKTNGYNNAIQSYGTTEYLLGIQAT